MAEGVSWMLGRVVYLNMWPDKQGHGHRYYTPARTPANQL